MTLPFRWKINIDRQCHYGTNKLQTFNFNTIRLFHLTSNFSTFFLAILPSEPVSLVSVLIATLTEYSTAAGHQKENPNAAGHKHSEKWQSKSVKAAAISSLYLTFEELLSGKSGGSNLLPFSSLWQQVPTHPLWLSSQKAATERLDKQTASKFTFWIKIQHCPKQTPSLENFYSTCRRQYSTNMDEEPFVNIHARFYTPCEHSSPKSLSVLKSHRPESLSFESKRVP